MFSFSSINLYAQNLNIRCIIQSILVCHKSSKIFYSFQEHVFIFFLVLKHTKHWTYISPIAQHKTNIMSEFHTIAFNMTICHFHGIKHLSCCSIHNSMFLTLPSTELFVLLTPYFEFHWKRAFPPSHDAVFHLQKENVQMWRNHGGIMNFTLPIINVIESGA